jgi:DNA modification methylase
MASLREYGVVIPVLIGDDNVILAGHGVTEAALRMGLEAVPCVRANHLTEAQRRAFVLAANRLAEDSSWNTEALRLEMLRLRDDFGVDLEDTGFTQREIVRLRLDMDFGNADEDAVPEASEPPVSRAGDVWELGEHRIICGDSTDARIIERLLRGTRPHLMVTDPPYGVSYDPSWRGKAGRSPGKRNGKVLNDDIADWGGAWALFPGDVAYIWHASLYGETVAKSIRANGFVIRSHIVWAKPHLVFSRGDYHWQHECCLYAVREDGGECPDMPGYCEGYDACWYVVREGRKSHWTGDRKATTLWDIDFSGQDAETSHGTQKPTECMRRAMLNNSEPGDLVYEPFCGSGTTIIAAQSVKRICYAAELNPGYVDMAVRRWQDYASRTANLSGTNKSFDTVTRERVGKHDK